MTLLIDIQNHRLYHQVKQFIDQEQLFKGIDHVEVALSGGADSVCLLAILWGLQQTSSYCFTLRAHHIRHHLRLDDDHDAAQALAVAARMNIPFIQTNLSWETSGKPQANVEEVAREARYGALFRALEGLNTDADIAFASDGDKAETREFASLDGLKDGGWSKAPKQVAARMPNDRHSAADAAYAAKRRIDAAYPMNHAIALAHHGDENVETLLWRLGRGCGLEGVGLAPKRVQKGVVLVRPLLGVSKAAIYEFLNDCQLPWAEDPTNATDKYRRNRIRQQILPALRAEAMSETCLYRSLIQLRHDAEALGSFAEHFVQNQQTWQGAWYCPWKAWETLSRGAKAQVLRVAARYLVAGCCPDAKFIAQALEMLEKRAQTHRQMRGKDVVLAWSNGGLMVFPTLERQAPESLSLQMPCQGVDIWQLCRISMWKQTMGAFVPANTKSMLHIDAQVVQGTLMVRPACDFPQLQTAVGNLCKTREALRSQGVPDCWRPYWPILCDDHRPLWVLGGMRTFMAKPPHPECEAICIHLDW